MAKHVLIVGGGIAGLASAWELARNGLRVSLLERQQPGQESSWAGAGILSALLPWNYGRPVNRLIQTSLAQFPMWIAALRQVARTDPEYRPTGMLVLPPFDAQAADRWLNDRALGLDSLPAAVAARVPAAATGLWLSHVAQVRNPRILRALREACESAGVVIHEMSQVTGLKTAGERVSGVMTDERLWQADDYLLTSREILKRLAAGQRYRVLLSEGLQARIEHMRADDHSGAWVQQAVKARERANKDHRDLALAAGALDKLLQSLPAAQKKIAPYVEPAVLIEDGAVEAARARVLEAAKLATAEIEKTRQLDAFR